MVCLVGVPIAAALAWLVTTEPEADNGPQAEPAPAESTPVAGQLTDTVDVNALFDRGMAWYRAGDPIAALDWWTKAYQAAPATESGQAFRVSLAPHMAAAHHQVYRRTGDGQSLERAITIQRWHIREYKRIHPPTAPHRDHVTRMQTVLVGLEGERTQLLQPAPAVAPPPVATPVPTLPPTPALPPPSRATRQAMAKDVLRDDPVLWSDYRAGRGLVTGGGVLLGLGGSFLIVALVTGASTVDDDPDARRLTYGFGITGALAVSGGIAMVVSGSILKRRAWSEALERVSLTPTWSTTGTRMGAGAQLSVRF